ncbi:MAG: RIP metalloprotease RseP, partial [Planctomycetota bacterium]
PDRIRTARIDLALGGDDKKLVHAIWLMQVATERTVELTYSREGKEQTVRLRPERNPESDLFFPFRGMQFEVATVPVRAEGPLEALALGAAHARKTLLDIYLTLRNIVAGLLSVKELRGPLGIAQVAYKVAQQGLPELLLFLGLLSINLAVLNFLPIPVLDGGHMVFLIWEAVTRKRPSERVVIAATYVGMLFVLGLMLFVIYLDLFEHKLGL